MWDTPSDAAKTDCEGTHLDLHIRHPPVQEWFRAANQYACYFTNPTQEWINIGGLDNSRLEIDDMDGSGHEGITLNHPEQTEPFNRWYRVAVHDYRDFQCPFFEQPVYGPIAVTVRVYLSGELASETRRELLQTNDFWEAVDILWHADGPEIVDVDALSSETF